jgi:type I restriction enzyme S subunit
MSEFPPDWTRTTFGNVLKQRKEAGFTNEELLAVTSSLGIVRRDTLERRDTSNEDKSKYLLVEEGDIAYNTMRMWQGVSGVSRFKGIVSPAYTICTPTEGIDKDFAGYLLKDPEMISTFRQRSQGLVSDTWNLKYESFAQIPCTIPPLPEQKRIAEILSGIDNAIDKAKTLMQKERLAFDAILNQEIANIDTRHHKKAEEMLDENILVALKDGNHGEQYPRRSEFVRTGTPYLSASSISDDGDIDLASCPCLSEERSRLMRIPPAQGGDVILTHNASIGKVGIIPEEVKCVIASTSTTYYRANEDLLLREFLAATLKSDHYQDQLKRIMGQSTRNQVPITAQKELVLIVPPKESQHKIAQIYSSSNKSRLGRVVQIKCLQMLRNSLCSDLLSGRKRVSV